MKTLNVKEIVRNVTLDGMMTFSQFENGMRAAQFECCEDVCMEPFSTRCKVQTMRDGNVYITELPQRLVRQASAIARKVMMDMIGNY